MAENKKSFLLYADLIHTVSKMSDGKAGQLFKTILLYVNDENPVVTDKVTELVFEPIKQQLKRDLKRWEELRKKQSLNGAKGGRPKKDVVTKETQNNPENPSLLEIPTQSLNANVNANVNVKESSSYDVFELMRRNTSKENFSDGYLKVQAIKFVKKYNGSIGNPTALINTWVANLTPDVLPDPKLDKNNFV